MNPFVRTALLGAVVFMLSCEDDEPSFNLPRVTFVSPIEILGSENSSLALGVQNGSVQVPDQPLAPRRSDERSDYYGMRFTLNIPPANRFAKIGTLYLERRVYADPDHQQRPLQVDRVPLHNLPPNGGPFPVTVPEWRFPANATYTTFDLIYSLRDLKNVRIARAFIAYCLPCRLFSTCRMQNGSFRPYKCKFQVERITVLNPDGSPMTTWQLSTDTLKISRSGATASEPAGPGGTSYTWPFRMTFRRTAYAVFPPKVGYDVGYAWLTAPLNTPGATPGSLAEYRYLATGVAMPTAIGGTTDVNFSMSVVFTGGGPLQPPAFFAIENDSTTKKFTGTQLMGNNAEAYAVPKIRFVP